MNKLSIRGCVALIVAAIFMAFVISACNDGGSGSSSSSSSSTISGTAASGAPITGTVYVKGANGVLASATIGANGSFTVDVTGLTAPYVLWAEGVANDQNVKLYSYVSASGTANITPATNMAVALAIGADPVLYYVNATNASVTFTSIPAAALTTAKTQVAAKLQSALSQLGLSNSTDVMTVSFTANGTGFDKLLDVVGIDVSNGTVTLTNKITGDTIYQVNVVTNSTTVDLVGNGTSNSSALQFTQGSADLDAIKAGMSNLDTLYASGNATLAQLTSTMRPIMANTFLQDGYGPDDMLKLWANYGEGPWIGFKTIAVSMFRPMQDANATAGLNVSEKPGYSKGYWVILTYGSTKNPARSETMLTSFVYDGSKWLWFGNRRPVTDGGGIRTRAIKVVNTNSTVDIFSGLHLNAKDDSDIAWNSGIRSIVVVGPGITATLTNNSTGLVMRKTQAGDDYFLSNLTDVYSGGSMLFKKYYLVADSTRTMALPLTRSLATKGSEYRFVSRDASNNQVGTWIVKLPAQPEDPAVLLAGNSTLFPSLSNITSHSLSNLPVSSGSLTVSWTIPSGMYPYWAQFNWNGTAAAGNNEIDNPAQGDASKDFNSWTSTLIPTGSNYAPISGNVSVAGRKSGSALEYMINWRLSQ